MQGNYNCNTVVVILSQIYRIAQSRSDIDLPLWHSPIDLPTSTIYTVASLSAIFQTAFPVQGRRKTEMKRIINHGPVYYPRRELSGAGCRQTRPRREVTCFLEGSWNLVAYHVEVGSSALHSASLAVARVYSYCLAGNDDADNIQASRTAPFVRWQVLLILVTSGFIPSQEPVYCSIQGRHTGHSYLKYREEWLNSRWHHFMLSGLAHLYNSAIFEPCLHHS